MQILHDFRGNGDGSHPSGVAADAAGNVYGAMSTRDTGVGMVYEIASKGRKLAVQYPVQLYRGF